ncbi:hypothetical protein [Trinickia sp.]|uniref:hypothetical protein n=1 Tax=Trinickia sp. TaxID=2571163 RepID=UPI003F7E3629
MVLIPVVLRFSGLSQNYNLCLTLTTPGAVWSMGEDGEDCLGISYNALMLDDKRASCIQRLEFSGSTLTIYTGPVAGADFELTAFIEVPDGTWWLKGSCILNEKARISARLGDLDPVEWRDEINCMVPILLPDTHRVTLVIRNVVPGQSVRIQLAKDGSAHGGARWFAARLDSPDIGLRIRGLSNGAPLPIGTFGLDSENIVLTVAKVPGPQNGGMGLIVEAYIERLRECRYCPQIKNVRLKIDCDQPVVATAQIANHRPQYLAQVYKLFAL